MKIRVLQGIGDIFWVHQKLYEYVDDFEYVIQRIRDRTPDDVQTRAMDFLWTWPKVKSVETEYVSKATLLWQVEHIWDVADFLSGKIPFFNVNRWLELGNTLESLDSGTITWKFDLPIQEHQVHDNFCCLFVNRYNIPRPRWGPKDWAAIFTNVHIPIYILGASYDTRVITDVQTVLESRMNKTVRVYIDHSPAEVYYLLRECDFFVGFQSGLNVLADHFDSKQLMVYFNWLDQMRNTWVYPENRRTGDFLHMCFRGGSRLARRLVETNFLT